VTKHHALVRRNLDAFRGAEIDTAGDGFFASFEGPIRAIRCDFEDRGVHDLKGVPGEWRLFEVR
jgi:class 3 adenylate cyclase